MQFSVNYNQKDDYIVGNFIGDLNKNSVKEYAQAIIDSSKENNCTRLLNDLREANIGISIIEFYNFQKTIITEDVDQSWKRAIVAKENIKELDFYETVSYNQGYHLRIFNDIDKAIEWLNT
ncbi:MAG: hypothetical protein GY865_09110 [candidate division Zixibacteria bacterium]|nr:hypothetical protein [candidate division Zixibacteria bacterium]